MRPSTDCSPRSIPGSLRSTRSSLRSTPSSLGPTPASLPRKGDPPMDLRFFLTVFTTVFLAELGDKTQLATFLYAAEADRSKLVVFLGAASALVITSAIGVAFGDVVARYVS